MILKNITTTHWFFRCIHCGMWYSSRKPIKTKKCVFCHRTFQFKKSSKFTKKCTDREAVVILQFLKSGDTIGDTGITKRKISFKEVIPI